MKTFSTKFLKFTLVLIALTLAIPAFSARRPFVKKSKDGGNNGDCLLEQTGGPFQSISFTISIESLDFLNLCDLHVGYQFNNDPMTYVQLSGWELDNQNNWIAEIEIPFPYNFISSRCHEDSSPSQWSFGLFCEDNGDYIETLYDSAIDLFDLRICCEDIEPVTTGPQTGPGPNNDPGSGSGRDKFIKTNTIDAINLEAQINQSDSNEETVNFQQNVDYYVYDRHGNQVLALKGIPMEQSIQELIYNSNVRSGLYFIKYYDGVAIKTKKVFKQ